MRSLLFQTQLTRRRTRMLRVALLVQLLFTLNLVCFAQMNNAPPPPAKPSGDKPLTDDERAELLRLIRSLQERVEKLEAAQNSTDKSAVDKSRVHLP
jgi:hypothetical protein